MGKSVLISLFVLIHSLSFAYEIEDYFGVWKGEVVCKEIKYEVYVNFPGLGFNKNGYYKASDKKRPSGGYNGSFILVEKKDGNFKARIRTSKRSLSVMEFTAQIELQYGRMILDSFMASGQIYLADENTIIVDLSNDFANIKGKLLRITSKIKSKNGSKKSYKPNPQDLEKLKPIVIEKK